MRAIRRINQLVIRHFLQLLYAKRRLVPLPRRVLVPSRRHANPPLALLRSGRAFALLPALRNVVRHVNKIAVKIVGGRNAHVDRLPSNLRNSLSSKILSGLYRMPIGPILNNGVLRDRRLNFIVCALDRILKRVDSLSGDLRSLVNRRSDILLCRLPPLCLDNAGSGAHSIGRVIKGLIKLFALADGPRSSTPSKRQRRRSTQAIRFLNVAKHLRKRAPNDRDNIPLIKIVKTNIVRKILKETRRLLLSLTSSKRRLLCAIRSNTLTKITKANALTTGADRSAYTAKENPRLIRRTLLRHA